MNPKPITSSAPQSPDLVSQVASVLGDLSLPNNALLEATSDGGILATATEQSGTQHTVRVNAQGQAFLSVSCSDADRQHDLFEPNLGDQFPQATPTCVDIHNLKQFHSPISQEKLTQARNLILGAKTVITQNIVLNLESLDPKILGLTEERRTVDTGAYAPKEFVGYRFADVLHALLKAQGVDISRMDLTRHVVHFKCTDGYELPAVTANGLTPLSTILNGNDFLASGIGSAKNWTPIEEGGLIGTTPTLYYVMGDLMLPETWPLMVKEIQIKPMP